MLMFTTYQAKERCIEDNGNLAVICDEETNSMVVGIMQSKGNVKCVFFCMNHIRSKSSIHQFWFK